MHIRNVKRLAAIMLLFAAATSLVCCGNTGGAPTIASVNLMEGIASKLTSSPAAPSKDGVGRAADFGLRLFKECAGGRNANVLISPLSVLSALSMTANGAKGETLAQMERTLGMSRDELNEFYRNYAALLPSGDKYKLDQANSIWFKSDESFTVNGDFLQTNADYFGAEIYESAFDKSTLDDINAWVKHHTDGMIPEIIDEIPADVIMYLINALAFDAKWEEPYYNTAVHPGEFTLEDGTQQSVEFMYSGEDEYLKVEGFTGFKKYYKDRKYAFAALLPDEGVSVSELIASLDPAELMRALSEPEYCEVDAAIPKFEAEYSDELSDMLKAMGMTDAFDPLAADFSALGSSTLGNIYIGRVIHKTYISVDEKGTKAAAVTAVEMPQECEPAEIRTVHLDRPFVYMLIDCETNLPFFIGMLTDPTE